jgi:GMP synthase (glutamine-hydrolysing)
VETQSPLNQAIVVLDFGAQYSQLIARRIREQKVFSVVLPFNASLEEIRSYSPVGIILSGGRRPFTTKTRRWPTSVSSILASPCSASATDCSSWCMRSAAKCVRPRSASTGTRKSRFSTLTRSFFRGCRNLLAVWMSHGDSAEELPAGFRLTAKTPDAVAAIENAERKMWAVQFHPEVHHTPLGTDILRNFALNICGAKPSWTPQHFIDATVAQVKTASRQAGGRSARFPAAWILRSQRCWWIAPCAMLPANRGSLACSSTMACCARTSSKKFSKICATILDCTWLPSMPPSVFMKKLAGVSDPETKRKIIGNEFIEVFDDEAHRILKEEGQVEWLVQGTLYPDVIESRSVRGPSQVIKSHHNVGGLPEKMKLKLIEPLKDLFKDEVRRIGRDLGMPEDILQRQPFPGPGWRCAFWVK